MTIAFFCPRWGFEHIPWMDFCRRAAIAGYDGVESPIPFDEKDKQEMKEALSCFDLSLIGQYYQSFEKDFEDHERSYRLHLENMHDMDCLLIDSQTGKDYFSVEQNIKLFEVAARFTRNSGIPVAHETHRNKALFSTKSFSQLIQHYQELFITADFSHWCCVSESLLEDQSHTVAQAIHSAMHIHARVGYQQSPQVPDPRAEEYQQAFAAHLSWWDKIVEKRKSRGFLQLTITPEFGPPPYLQTNPYTKEPVADQWELNQFMMNFLKKRYCAKALDFQTKTV